MNFRPGLNVLVGPLEVNGRDVEIDAIVERIETLSALFSGRYSPIVVFFDREERSLSAEEIARMVSEKLAQKRPTDRYVVGVADRMIENWILADWEGLRASIPSLPTTPPEIEGKNGKSILRRLLGARGYSTTIDGPDLLRKARPSYIQRSSRSFDRLKRQIAFSCWWLAQ